MTTTEQRFYGLLKADGTSAGDVERMQLFYVLARTNALWEVSASIYDTKTHCIKEGWDDIFDNTFGKMLKRTMHLFNSYNEDISTVKLLCGMDEHNMETMINAQMIYSGLWDYGKEMK
ncbi:MAG: DUF6075 family protein [Lachnospiraceae bacterium]|nr:DUF6075 family protein [Lachnospiraceae bacterium]